MSKNEDVYMASIECLNAIDTLTNWNTKYRKTGKLPVGKEKYFKMMKRIIELENENPILICDINPYNANKSKHNHVLSEYSLSTCAIDRLSSDERLSLILALAHHCDEYEIKHYPEIEGNHHHCLELLSSLANIEPVFYDGLTRRFLSGKERHIRLVKFINKHNELYYNKGKPEISDAEYDKAFNQLLELEKSFPELKTADSPTNKVGAPVNSTFAKVKHSHPMLSLQNAFTASDLDKWLTRIKYNREFTLEPKLDGMSLSVVYTDGKLVQALTRGDGETGEDITANASTIMSLPKVLKDKDLKGKTVVVRGEVVMFKDDFNQENKQLAEAGQPLLSNPRNAVAGALRRKSPEDVAKRRLMFIPYDIIREGEGQSQIENLSYLRHLGFIEPTPIYRIFGSNITSWLLLNHISYFEAIRPKLPYDIDGVVIKINSLNKRAELGATSRYPNGAIAYKFPEEGQYTLLEDIEFQVGRTGVITPVALFEPVVIGGVSITRASVVNHQQMKKLKLHEGDTVEVIRAGEVIPKIKGVIESRPSTDPFEFITTCPSCSTSLQLDSNGVSHYCPNHDACPDQLTQQLLWFASKSCMDIKGLGRSVAEKLVSSGKLNNGFKSLYQLTLDDLKTCGVAGKTAVNLIHAIQKSKKDVVPWRFLNALGIEGLGKENAKQLIIHLGSLNMVIDAVESELISTPGVGKSLATNILSRFEDTVYRDSVVDLMNLMTFTKEA